MIKILFIRSPNAYLPEIDAYIKYFNTTKDFIAYDVSCIDEFRTLNNFDIIWEFKGFGGIKVKEQILVHEYASLSTGRFPKSKNLIKSRFNYIPNIRIFLNQEVKSNLYFRDNIKYCYRDMGIDQNFIITDKVKKEFDFVYVGLINKDREMDKFLHIFSQRPNGKLCLIGDVEMDIYSKFKNNTDITFLGRVKYDDVPKLAAKANYGINYIPDKFPYNIQTSTKLLEYLALNLKIITTDYQWVRNFEIQNDSWFYKLDYHNLQFDIDDINQHKFRSNFKSNNFLWNTVIKRSGIEDILRSKI